MVQIKVGWLADRGKMIGGAEINAAHYLSAAPKNVKIIDCPPDDIDLTCDIYVINNCTSYTADIIHKIEGKKIIKVLHDIWDYGDVLLRAWLLKNADMTILVSPSMVDWLKWQIKTPFRTCPSMIHMPPKARFKPRKQTACWIGRLHPQKGLDNAIEWADKNGVQLDVYGFGDESLVTGNAVYKGELKPEQVIPTMQKYKTFVFLPNAPDACPRVIIEAWAAGCEIVTNKWQGSTYWLNNNQQAILKAGERFWGYVL